MFAAALEKRNEMSSLDEIRGGGGTFAFSSPACFASPCGAYAEMFWNAIEYPSLSTERTGESQGVVDNRADGREGTSGLRPVIDVKRRGSPV